MKKTLTYHLPYDQDSNGNLRFIVLSATSESDAKKRCGDFIKTIYLKEAYRRLRKEKT